MEGVMSMDPVFSGTDFNPACVGASMVTQQGEIEGGANLDGLLPA
jgi:hypothetical protein